MEAKRVADLTVEELQAIILETKPVSDLTVGELKAIIAEVVDRRLINWLNTANQKSYIVLPARTKEEQTQGNLAKRELLQKWLEEGNAEERIELVEFYQKIFGKAPIKSSAVLPARTNEEQMQRNLAAIEWLRKWREEGDPEEQTETFEYLQKVLDEDRLSSNRSIFGQQK
ncbi:hypothetical protein [Microcoleus vaginatus]|uniref:hypothetical protein n=1 Tax=Microcoleus vaginatus TaxID=119532 RepID=UPI0016858522|nr:hypothetical protein [Microcoleus sp. FACHB-84]MBD2009552.1 hypothetical protein [Microcoleus sp. FACHB-45]